MPTIASASIDNRHYPIATTQTSVLYTSGQYWIANGNRLETYTSDPDCDQEQLKNIQAYAIEGTPVGLEKDRQNIYFISSKEILIIPINHQTNVQKTTLKSLGFVEDISGYSFGSRVIVFNKTQVTSYDPYAENWLFIKQLNLAEGETVRHVVERYGLLAITTNNAIRFISTTNDDFQRLEIPALQKHDDLLVNDFVITGKVAFIWFAAVKQVLKIELKINEKNKSVDVGETKYLSPFTEINLSNIKRIAFWNERLITIFDDGLYALDPASSQWNAIIADPGQKHGLKPTFSFKGKINTVLIDKDRIVAATSNHGVLQINFSNNQYAVSKLTSGKGLPTDYIQDISFDDKDILIVQSGDGIYKCKKDAASCDTVRAASLVAVPAYDETKFAKSIVRFQNSLVYMSQGKIIKFNESEDKEPVEITLAAGQDNKPLSIISDEHNLFVITPAKVFIFNEEFVLIKAIDPSLFVTGKHFDAAFSAGAVDNGKLLLGLKKTFEQKINNDEPIPEIVQQKRKDEPNKFIQYLDNAYILDLKTFSSVGFAKQNGLYTKNVLSAFSLDGQFYMLGHDIKSGKKRIYRHSRDGRSWESLAQSETDKYQITRIDKDYNNIIVYHEQGSILIDVSGKVIASLSNSAIGDDKNYPGQLLRPDGFFNHDRFGFYSGSDFRYFDKTTGIWGYVTGDTTYDFQPLGNGEIAISGPDTIRLLYPDVLAARLAKNEKESDFTISLDSFEKSYRARTLRQNMTLSELFGPNDILYDVQFKTKPGVTESQIVQLMSQIDGEATKTSSPATGDYFVKLKDAKNLSIALNAITKSELVAFSSPNPLRNADKHTQIIADELTLTFSPDATENDILALLKRYGLEPGPRTGQHTYVVFVKNQKNIVLLSNEIQQEAMVRYSELNYISKAASTGVVESLPNDPQFKDQWYLRQTGFNEVWNMSWPYQHTIAVAVLDSGVDATHPDLAGQVLDGPDFVDLDFQADDASGHGTQVAGIIAAGLNNALGMSGICGNCNILRVRIADENGLTTSELPPKNWTEI